VILIFLISIEYWIRPTASDQENNKIEKHSTIKFLKQESLMKILKIILTYSFLTLALSTAIHGMDDEQKIEVYNETKYVSNIDPSKHSHIELTSKNIFITLGNSKKPTSLPEFHDNSFSFEDQKTIEIYRETIQRLSQEEMQNSKFVLMHYATLKNTLIRNVNIDDIFGDSSNA